MSPTGTPGPAARPEAKTAARAAVKPERDGVAELKALDAVFSALAHPQRRQILTLLLARGGAVRAGDIASRFECSWPTTTRHLRALEDAGLVAVESQGRERIYALRSQRLREVVGGWLARFPA